MALYTYDVKWTEGNPNRIYHRGVLTSTPERAVAFYKEGKEVFELISVKQRPKRTTYCDCCGSVLNKNYI